jgi:hypothetical protein
MALMQTFAALGLRTADEASTSEIGPGLTAFAIVVLLAIATFLLLRSMLHHIRKVPPTFEAESSAETLPRDDGDGEGGSHPNVG